MRKPAVTIRRAFLPVGVFLAVSAIHYAWIGLLPVRDPAQDRWVTVFPVENPSWIRSYTESGSYWLGYSYALSLAFAATALRRYREERLLAARAFAIGGASYPGILALLGCYLLGCCGSPMAAVYLSIFGTAFLPFAKPLAAALTTFSILCAWRWIVRHGRPDARKAGGTTCNDCDNC